MLLADLITTNIGGIETACVNRKDLAQLIGLHSTQSDDTLGLNQAPIVIFSCNGHAISIANQDGQAMKLINSADLVHADGQSVVTFSKLTSGPEIPERTATTDMIHDIPKFFKGTLKHFLLGSKTEIVSKAAKIYSDTYQNVDIVGFHHGYFDQTDEDELCNIINKSGANVLWIGLGKPKEQEFCIRNKDKLKVDVMITCGGCYNYITGDYPRAPVWMQNVGFEWLYRMMTMPKQLIFRYLTTNPHAIYCVLRNEYCSNRL